MIIFITYHYTLYVYKNYNFKLILLEVYKLINNNIKYKVTGRYMDGQKIIGYHLVGEDGSQSQETKERVIWLIGKGIITNMRIQIGQNKEVIIRGKGVNLNNLPVYDAIKQQYRDDDISQSAANTKVPVSKDISDASPMGQFTIVKRIMFKNKCLGYEVSDYSGTITRMKRDNVIQLAVQKLISNAIAQKYKKPNKMIPDIILRGVGCDLSKLPILIITEEGKIIDPTIESSDLTVRSAYMKHSGIIRNTLTNDTIQFRSGDFIICGANGELSIKSRIEVEEEYARDTDSTKAICDDYLNTSSDYFIEIFGNKPISLTADMIKTWAILKPKLKN